MTTLNPSLLVQLISCTAACVGFALWFKVKGRQVFYAGLGAFCTWGVYTLAERYHANYFLATMVAAIFVAGYAQIMARINKAPATIFLSVCAFPLIPGNNLYYVMYGVVMREPKVVETEAKLLLLTCLGIALGFILVEIVNKYAVILYAPFRRKRSSE